MAEERKAMVAFHSDLSQEITNFFQRKGYSVTQASNLNEMLEKMGIPETAGRDSRPTVYYEWYIMDTNLCFPDNSTCESAARVYGYIKQEIAENRVEFMSLTANNEAEKMAVKRGIPVINKCHISKVVDFYLTVRKVRED